MKRYILIMIVQTILMFMLLTVAFTASASESASGLSDREAHPADTPLVAPLPLLLPGAYEEEDLEDMEGLIKNKVNDGKMPSTMQPEKRRPSLIR